MTGLDEITNQLKWNLDYMPIINEGQVTKLPIGLNSDLDKDTIKPRGKYMV